MQAIDTVPFLTLNEFLTLPETKPAQEYHNGEISQKPMPQGKHSKLQTTLVSRINQLAEPSQLAYGFTELRCTFAGRSIVPDISVFQWQHIPLNKNGEILDKIEIPPDWIIEILSPEQSSLKIIEKISFTIKNGCQLGWLIAPSEKVVMIFENQQLPETKSGQDILPVLKELKEWHISPEEIFRWLSFHKKQTP